MELFTEFFIGLLFLTFLGVSAKGFRMFRSRPVTLEIVPKDEAGKHCGPKILEEYALGQKGLQAWVVVEIGRNLESCEKCRWQVSEILWVNLP